MNPIAVPSYNLIYVRQWAEKESASLAYLLFAGFVQNIHCLQCYLVVQVIELVGGEGIGRR